MPNAGEFLGEGCLAGQPLHLASASTTAESSIVKIEKEAMIRALRDDPTFSQLFMAYLLSRNVQIEADLVDQLFNRARNGWPRSPAARPTSARTGKLDARHSHINSGDVGGAGGRTTRSRINYFMNKFRKLGFIEYNGSLKGALVAPQRGPVQSTLSSFTTGDAIMDKDRIQGSIKQVVGGIKEAVGKAAGDQKTEADGKAEKAAGKFQNAVGSLKDTVRETFKR